MNYNGSGDLSNDMRDRAQRLDVDTTYVRAFHDFMRTNPSASEIQARYPSIDAEFIRQVAEFVERYRPALEELAQR